MGISCQINLSKTPEGLYRPGGEVNGVIKYIIDKETVFTNIVISFKGKGEVNWSVPGDDSKIYYSNFEEYVTVNNSLTNNVIEERTLVTPGMYIESFNFTLPTDIPSSYTDSNCKITYYVSVKFTKIGVFNNKKKFKAMLNVKSLVKPPHTPLNISSCNILSNVLKNNGVRLKIFAVASKNFLVPGEEVNVDVEVENDTGLDINKINVYIIESLTFTSKRRMTYTKNRKVKDCKRSIHTIPRRNFNKFFVTLPTRLDIYSIQNSRIFQRDYKILILVKLPLPHRRASAEIPLVIGELAAASHNEPLPELPPPYWDEDNRPLVEK